MKYSCYSDPSHAWVKVPIETLMELGIHTNISKFSFKKGEYAYLEEDRDLGIFIEAMKKAGKSVTFKEYPTDRQSRVRGYDSYTGEVQCNANVCKI